MGTQHATFSVERLSLANGLQVVLQPDPQVPLVAMNATYFAGARDEPADRSGLAHLCEHLAFTGPARGYRDSFPALLQRQGGTANGSTSYDHCRFESLLPSAELAVGLWVEGQRLSGRVRNFSSEALEVERKVLREERRQRVENRPYGRAIEKIHQLLYPEGHPYHRSPSGSLEGLAAITSEDVERFFAALYTPRNAVLTMVGDLDPDRVVPLLEEYVAPIPGGPAPPTRPDPVLLDLDPEARHRQVDRVPAPRSYVAFRGGAFGSRGWHAAILLSEFLGVGRKNPLHQKMVQEAGLAQDVETYLFTMSDSSTVAFSATAAPGVDVQELESVLVERVEELLSTSWDEGDFLKIQKRIGKGIYHKIQDLVARSAFCTNLKAWTDASVDLVKIAERFVSFDAEDLSKAGRELCRPGDRVVLSVVPPSRREGDAC